MKTPVLFRKFKKEILAVFPYEMATPSGNCSCYAHVGQHSACDYNYIIRYSKPASVEEVKELSEELISIGYELKIIKRRNFNKVLTSYKKMIKR